MPKYIASSFAVKECLLVSYRPLADPSGDEFAGVSTWGDWVSGLRASGRLQNPFCIRLTPGPRPVKIDGLRLVGGNPDFTNAPGHGDDDERFYDRQQAYVHARGG